MINTVGKRGAFEDGQSGRTARQKKDSFTVMLMKYEGTPCAGDVTLRTGTHINL